MSDLVRAAGGVVWRDRGGVVEILVIHRDRYDDWSLPKGKLDPGETWEQAAVREVFEETGIVSVLGPELESADYVDHHGRDKLVRFWSMTVAPSIDVVPNDEVDALAWMDMPAAAGRLTYEREVTVVESFGRSMTEDG